MKHLMIEADDRGWWSLSGNVCITCAGEEYLASYTLENATAQHCDFCNRSSSEPIAADADEIMRLIGEGLYREWTHPVQVMGRVDGEWVGETYDINDVLWEVGVDDPTAPFWAAVADAFVDDLWCRADPYALEPHEALAHGWERFASHVKYHTRYVFLLESRDDENLHRDEIYPGRMLQRLGEVVRSTRIVRPITAGSRYVRVRDHEIDEQPQSARELGTPPTDKAARANRMSPAGIPMFYGSGDADTAIAEMGHSPRPAATYAEFVTLRDMQVVDLSRIPKVPSLFDEKRAHDRPAFRFLHDFSAAISQPIAGDEREHIEYVPTQVVTDYFRRIFRNDDGSSVDGLLYRSSRRSGGECCVLFVANAECVDLEDDITEQTAAALALDRSTRKTLALGRSQPSEER